MSIRKLGFAGVSALLALVLFLIWHWRPERQVRLHQQALFSALEDRDWKDVAALMADKYSDRWKHDKGFVLREAREVFRQFIAVQVQGEIADLHMEDFTGEVRTSLAIQGRGSPIAEYAMARVNALHEPWIFRWERQSAKPWDWQLIQVDQAELEIPQGMLGD